MDWRFRRYPCNPILPAVPGTWMEAQTANPDLLEIDDTFFLYFRGQQGGHDRIGLATVAKDRFDGATWNVRPRPVIDVGAPGEWDEQHVLDPATVRVGGKVFLYYSAVCPRCPRSICLATSDDGVHFTKFAGNPVAIGGGPEIVWCDGRFFLYYWKNLPDSTGFQLHLATSADGSHFSEHQIGPVLPVGPKRTRVFSHGPDLTPAAGIQESLPCPTSDCHVSGFATGRSTSSPTGWR